MNLELRGSDFTRGEFEVLLLLARGGKVAKDIQGKWGRDANVESVAECFWKKDALNVTLFDASLGSLRHLYI